MAILVQDSFNRTDSATSLGIADSGQTWERISTAGVWGIQSNQAYWVNGNPSLYTLESGQSDVQIALDSIVTSVGATSGAIGFRASDANNYWFFRYFSGGYQLYKVVGGTTTQIGILTETLPTGNYTFKVIANGSSIQCLVNDVLKLSTTDTHNATATKHGLRNHATTTTRFDNFLVESLGAGGTDITVNSIIADSTAEALIPTVLTVSSVSASVNIIAAALTVDAISPSVSTDSLIASTFGTVIADALNPSVTLSGNTSVISVITNVISDATIPVLSTDSNLFGVAGASTADALSPQVGSFTNISVNAVIVSATTDAISPNVDAIRNIGIQAAIADVTADALASMVGSSASAQITAVITSLTADAVAPSVFTTQSSRIDSVIAGLTADALNPAIKTDAVISAIITELYADAFAPKTLLNVDIYREVISVVLNITRKQSSTLGVTRKQTALLEVTQRMQSELKI